MEHPIFAVSKLSLTGAARDDIVACSWDGMTFILDQQKNVSCFEFPERVCAFTAGEFALRPGQNVPCFFYVTFSDQIFVYYNVRFHSTSVISLTDLVYPRLVEVRSWACDSSVYLVLQYAKVLPNIQFAPGDLSFVYPCSAY